MRQFCHLLLVLCVLALSGCGVDWFPEIASVASFSFTPATVTDVDTGIEVTSSPIVVKILTGKAPAISISGTGASYSINSGAFTTTAGIVNDGDQVRVKVKSDAANGKTTTATLTIAGKTATFSVTTRLITVSAFKFSPAGFANVSTGKLRISNPIVVNITAGTSAPISITNGLYKIGTGAYTGAAGTVIQGDTVTVQNTLTTSPMVTTLTIANQSATFSSTTADVAPITLFVTAPAGTSPVVGLLNLVLKNGSYNIGFTQATNSSSGLGGYSLDADPLGPNGTILGSDSTQTLTNGQTFALLEDAPATPGTTNTITVTIGTVPISMKVTAE